MQGPRIRVTAFAGSGTVNRTPLQRRGIRTSSINRTHNWLLIIDDGNAQTATMRVNNDLDNCNNEADDDERGQG